MRVAFHSFGADINSYGGGEHRWGVNWAYLVRSLGHEVGHIDYRTPSPSFDLCLDADDRCENIIDLPHIHNKFSPYDKLTELPCYKKHGTAHVSYPYISRGPDFHEWAESRNFRVHLLPMAYPDELLPKNLQPGFDRTEIAWLTKDPFCPDFLTAGHPRAYVPRCAVHALKAVARLSKRADFKFTLGLEHFLSGAPAQFELDALVRAIPNVEKRGIIPWGGVVDLLGRSKLSLPIGDLAGSLLETMFTYGIPMVHSGVWFYENAQAVVKLPHPKDTDEHIYYDALESFWFDPRTYGRAMDYHQQFFKTHRTDSLKFWFQRMLDEMRIA